MIYDDAEEREHCERAAAHSCADISASWLMSHAIAQERERYDAMLNEKSLEIEMLKLALVGAETLRGRVAELEYQAKVCQAEIDRLNIELNVAVKS